LTYLRPCCCARIGGCFRRSRGSVTRRRPARTAPPIPRGDATLTVDCCPCTCPPLWLRYICRGGRERPVSVFRSVSLYPYTRHDAMHRCFALQADKVALLPARRCCAVVLPQGPTTSCWSCSGQARSNTCASPITLRSRMTPPGVAGKHAGSIRRTAASSPNRRLQIK